jgi:hypothetical protein
MTFVYRVIGTSNAIMPSIMCPWIRKFDLEETEGMWWFCASVFESRMSQAYRKKT